MTVAGAICQRLLRPTALRVVLAACLLAGEVLLGGPAILAAEPTTGSAAALRFRRYYAPADRIDDWPFGSTKYEPVRAEDFERLVAALQSVTPVASASLNAHIADAQYEARLDGADLVGGKARWNIRLNSQAALPTVLAMTPCGLALGTTVWQDTAAPALIGTRHDGTTSLLVEQEGIVEADWTLRGTTEPSGLRSFDLILPRATSSTLVVDLSAELLLTASAGLVSEADAADTSRRRWQIELGGVSRVTLRIGNQHMTADQRRLALLRQSTTYEVSEQGIEVGVQLRIDVHQQPLAQLELVADPGLQLVAARYDDEIPWTVVPSPTGDNRWLLTFNEPLLGSGRTVRLRAIAPLPTGTAVRLPRVRAEGLFWQEGSLALWVPAPLEVRMVTVAGCRQTRSAPLVGMPGESFEFQAFAPDATVEVLLARRRESVQLVSGTTVRLSASEMHSQFVGQFSLAAGERFLLKGEVPPHWIIDTVDSDPPGAIADWSLESQEQPARILTLRLAQALSADSPLRLLIAAHARTAPPDGVYDWDLLETIDFAGVMHARRLLALRPQGAAQLRLEYTDDCVRVDPALLDEASRGLLALSAGDVVLEVTSDHPLWTARLEKQAPVFSAEVEVDAYVAGNQLLESYRWSVHPESSQVEQLLIHFSEPRPEPPQFTLGPNVRGQLIVEPLSVESQMAEGLGVGGETWQVTLRRPRNTPFQIHAARSTPLDAEVTLSLASLPEAATQRGTLLVRAAADTPLEIARHRLRPLVSDATTHEQAAAVRAALHFDPLHDTGPALVTQFEAPRQPLAQPGAVVWKARFDSQYSPIGAALHLATWDIETRRGATLALQLPSAAETLGVWLDEQALTPPEEGEPWQIVLDPALRFVRLTAQFREPAEGLKLWSAWQPPELSIGLPVLSREWNVWLPPGYDMLASDNGWQSLNSARPGWTQRLFGSLARGGSEPFDPLSVSDWQQLTGSSSAQTDQQRLMAVEMLTWLGAARQSLASAAVPQTWGELVRTLENSTAAPAFAWRIDPQAASRAAPETKLPPLEFDPTRSPLDRALELLLDHELALVITPDGAVLTSGLRIAANRHQLLHLGMLGVYGILPGPLEDHWRTAWRRADQSLLTAAAWQLSPGQPWPATTVAGSRATDHLGWSVYQLTAIRRTPSAWIVKVSSVRALGVAAGLLMAAMAWFALRDRAWWLLSAAVLLAVISLLVPAALVPLTSGALVGALAALAASILLPRAGAQRRTTSHLAGGERSSVGRSKSSSVAPAAGGLLLAAVLGVAGSQPAAAQPMAATRSAEEDAFKVFIPTNGEGQPTGERYYVPEALHRELQRRARLATGAPDGWLLQAAAYQVSLSRDAVLGRLVVAGLSVRYDLFVFSPEVPVRIPLRRAGLSLAEDAALLDGRPASVFWDETGSHLLCDVVEPGPARLEINLSPTTISSPDATWFEMGIPRQVGSTLELNLPADLPGVEVPTAVGTLRYSENRQRASVALGPTDRLVVRWSERPGARLGPTFDVDELWWLRVRPGSVLLEAQIRLKVVEGQLRELRLAADPRLRVLPQEMRDTLVAAVRPVVGDGASAPNRQVMQVDFSRPLMDESMVRLSFLVADASGIGQLRLPQVDVLATRNARRMLALSVDPMLEYTISGDGQLPVVAVPEFLTAWGRSDWQPQAAWQVPRTELAWSLATRPRKARTRVDQTLMVGLDRYTATVAYTARLETLDGFSFQHRLVGVPGMEVDSVSLIEDGAQRVARWSATSDGTLTVFLTGPVSGEQRLSLRGRFALPKTNPFALPMLRLADAELASNRVQIYRRPAALVEVVDASQLSPAADESLTEAPTEMSRLVAAFRGESPDASLMLRVETNQPRVEITQVASLERDGGNWETAVDCHVRVVSGVVDALRFEVPPGFAGPLEVEPPTPHELVPVPGQSRWHLVLRPRAAVTDQYRVRFRGVLSVAPGQSPAMPDVLPLNTPSPQRYYRLPTQIGLDQVAWETLRMEPAPLPPPFDSGAVGEDAWLTYRATGDSPRAVLSAVAPGLHRPKIHLADVYVTWSGEAAFRGLATFDLEGAGRNECRLRLPANVELLSVRVAGLIVTTVAEEESVWRLPLVAGSLPLRIEVLYSGVLPPESIRWDRAELPAPTIDDFPIVRTLWTIFGPAGAGVGETLSASSVPAWRQELIRLQALTALMQVDPDVASVERPAELVSWYRPWAHRWIAARMALRRWLADAPAAGLAQGVETELTALDAQRQRAAQRIGAANVFDALQDQPQPVDQPSQLWQFAYGGQRPVTTCVVEGAASTVTVRYPYADNADWLQRLGCCVLLVAGWIVICRTLPAFDAPRRWPQLLGVIVGLGWWLWLSPSVVGLVIVGISLLAGLHPSLRAAPDPSSTIIRISSSYR